MISKHSSKIFFVDIFIYLSIIILLPRVEILLLIPLIIIQGIISYRLTFILHDCSHYSLFKRRKHNIILGNIIAGILFSTFSSFKKDHSYHHKYLWEKKDPQLDDYNNVSFNLKSIYIHLIKPLLLFNLINKILKVFKGTNYFFNKSSSKSKKQHVRRKAILQYFFIIFVQLVIFILVTGGGSKIWILPLDLTISTSIVLFLSRLRGYLEHGPTSKDELNKVIVRSHNPGVLGNIFLSNLWFSYHYEHHQKPNIESQYLKNINFKNRYENERPSSSYLATFAKLNVNLTNPYKLRNKIFYSKDEIETEYVNCGMCGSNNYNVYSLAHDYEYETCANQWRFVRCNNCKNVYLNPRPVEEVLNTIYPNNYYSYNYDKNVSFISRFFKNILDNKRIESIISDSSISEFSKYLDIGCGDGRYMKLMMNKGFKKSSIYGTELSKDIVSKLKRMGFNALLSSPGSLNNLPKNEFNIITMFSVLEHVENPYNLLKECYGLLKPGGILVFEVPNIDSTNAWIFKDQFWGGYHAPRHWNLFNIDTLMITASSIGFRLKSHKNSTGHAFWLWSIHHYVKYRLGLRKIGNLLNPCSCWPLVIPITLIDLIRIKNDRETDNMIITLTK